MLPFSRFVGARGTLLLVLLVLACSDRPGRGGAQACRDCVVRLEPVVTLGSASDSLMLGPQTKLVLTPRSTFVAAPTHTAGVLAEFDTAGRLLRGFGKRGDGPGELASIMASQIRGNGRIIAAGGGRLVEYDYISGDVVHEARLPVFAPDLAPVGVDQYAVAAPIVVPGDSLAVAHILTATGSLASTFEYAHGVGSGPADTWSALRFLSPAPDGGIWSARANEYTLHRFDAQGRLVLKLNLQRGWFSPWAGSVPQEGFRVAPRPRLAGALEDRDGRLYVLAYVADDRWRPHGGKGEIRIDEVDFNRIFDTMIEVFDARSGRLLGAGRHPDMLRFVRNAPLVYSIGQGASGVWHASVYRLTGF